MASKERLLDQVLILRYQTGDQSAFERLVERHQGKLRYFVRRLLAPSAGEDDILQEVWLTVLRQLNRLRNPEAFTVWLYRIARNKVYRQLQRDRRYSPLADDVQELPQGKDEDEFSAEAAEQIHQCLEKLSPEHREVLVLCFLEQMSYEQVGQVVDCPLGTVRSRIYYAKRALRREMERVHNDGQ